MKIFLIGFMGAGKSTLGKYAARHNNLEFVDLDEWIENREGRTVRDIFNQQGEEHFRLLEQDALKDVASLPGDHLVACGGGTPCFFDNMTFMNQVGVTLYLDVGSARITERLRNSADKRPLLNSLKVDLQTFVHQKLVERAGFYAQANVIVPEEKANKQDLRKLVEDILEGRI